jgi:diguanylate cyclase (GGDEF)-like protein
VVQTDEIVELLTSLGRALGADFVQVQPVVDPGNVTLWWAKDPEFGPEQRMETVRLGQRRLSQEEQDDSGPRVAIYESDGMEAAAVGLYGSALMGDVLVVGRPLDREYESWEIETLRAYARVVPIVMDRAAVGSPLEDLVSHIATLLMSVNADTLSATLHEVVRTMGEFFGVSSAFIRRNDHTRGASILTGEWPLRDPLAAADPFTVVPFDAPDTAPVLAALKDMREPMVVRSSARDERGQQVSVSTEQAPAALLMVPVIRDEITRGAIGFINFDDRAWSKTELNALRAIASLLSQLGGRLDAEELLQERAYRDELTGLLNRRALHEALTARLEACAPEPVVIVFADLDHLKSLNDSFGHETGNDVLREIAIRLSAQTGAADLLARAGGDEFVFVFGTAPEDPVSSTQELLNVVTDQPFELSHATLSTTTMCAGIAIATPGTVNADELLRHADLALFEAKAAGHGQVQVFGEEMLASSQQRTEIHARLASAVSDETFELYYLPELDLRSGDLLAVEALIRWHHPTLGLLTPDSFIPLAEESPAIMKAIGAWVLDRACAQLAAWFKEFPARALTLRVNTSPTELMLGHMPTLVGEALIRHGLVGRDLCLEVTERTALRDLKRILSDLEEIRAMGVSVALDDFGTGYSTLTQLRLLPVDVLKLDRQFIKEMTSNDTDMVIVDSTIQLAQNFGLDVVAEGVDSPLTARELVRMGCHRAQGHLFHPAAPADVVGKIIDRGGFDLARLGLPAEV